MLTFPPFRLFTALVFILLLSSKISKINARESKPVPVPVLLGVMSQCPDAIYCESVFDDVLKQVGDIVDIQLTFIGKINDTDAKYGVTCLHGPNECRGNIHELCAAQTAPETALNTNNLHIRSSEIWRKWWDFVVCSNSFGRYEVGTEEVSTSCAAKAGLDLDWGCIDGKQGLELLKESVKVTDELGIQKSCTIIINGKKRCIRDDSQWKECDGISGSVDDFVRIIREEYDSLSA